MKKSHKIILVIIVVILLLFAFFGIYKYGTSKTKISDPESGAVEVQDVDSVTKIDQDSKSIKTQAKPKTASVTTSTTTSNSNLTQQIRVSVTAEERANCVKWQTAHGYVADGYCLYDKPYTQQYIEDLSNLSSTIISQNDEGNQNQEQDETGTQGIPPIVSAGKDQYFTNPTSLITLIGSISITPEAYSSGGDLENWTWKKISGDDNVDIENGNVGFARASLNYNKLANISGTHTYTFRLTATSKQGAVATDDTTVSITKTSLAPIAKTEYPNWYGSFSNDNRWNGQFMANGAETTVWFEFGSSPTDLGYSTKKAILPNTLLEIRKINIDDINSIRESGYFKIYFRAVAQNSIGISYGDILNYNFQG